MPHNSKVKSHLKFTELDINASQACNNYFCSQSPIPQTIAFSHFILDNFWHNDYDGLVWLVHIIPAFLGARPSEHSGSHSDVCLKLLSTSPGPAPGTKPYPELKIGLVTSTSSHWAQEYWSYALGLLTLNRSIEEREHFLPFESFGNIYIFDICFDVCGQEGNALLM